jgi:uncharacterized protein (TIGR04255 family)
MGQKMKNAPVYFAVAQVRFNAVLTLDQYVPAIQDSFRKAGFPDFQKGFTTTLNFNFDGKPTPDQPVNAMTQPQAQYVFLDGARHSGFILENMAMSFQSTHYDTFDVFLPALMRGLETVHKSTELNLCERVGVRFLDAVLPRAGEDVSDYLSPNLLGLYGRLPDRKFVHSISETKSSSGEGDLVSRAIIIRQDQKGNVAFPPDLIGPTTNLMDKFTNAEGVYGIIDTDASYGVREPFDLKSIEKRLISLHSAIRKSFDLMVTERALKVWE